MEYLENEIVNIVFTPESFTVTYDNDKTEVVEKNMDGYRNLYNAWLKEQPMFISDIYKTQMRDLTFAKSNPTYTQSMNAFFSEENREEALKFIVYMRKRDLTQERAKWKRVN